MYLIVGEQSGEVFYKTQELWKARSIAHSKSDKEKVSIVRNADRFKISTYFQNKLVLKEETK